ILCRVSDCGNTAKYKQSEVFYFVTFVKSNAKALLTSIRLSKDAVAPYGVVVRALPCNLRIATQQGCFCKTTLYPVKLYTHHL
ncbi:MAG: hypothetical protein IKL10_10570, partial [Clostridia bacterium]|nr:hypothetical protein [Clostridia bacterium]